MRELLIPLRIRGNGELGQAKTVIQSDYKTLKTPPKSSEISKKLLSVNRPLSESALLGTLYSFHLFAHEMK